MSAKKRATKKRGNRPQQPGNDEVGVDAAGRIVRGLEMCSRKLFHVTGQSVRYKFYADAD